MARCRFRCTIRIHVGKLRWKKDIAADFQNGPLGIVDGSGKITASLNAYVKVGLDTPLGFAGWSDSFNIASTTIADFNFSANQPAPPVLAVLNNGVLTLNMGPNAAARGSVNTTDGDESFTVSHVSTQGDGSETVSVAAFGYTKNFAGVRQIYAEGGAGNDTIQLLPGVISTAHSFGA